MTLLSLDLSGKAQSFTSSPFKQLIHNSGLFMPVWQYWHHHTRSSVLFLFWKGLWHRIVFSALDVSSAARSLLLNKFYSIWGRFLILNGKKKCWISSCARHSCQTTWPLLGVVGWSQAWATELAKSITEAVQIQTRELFRISAQTFTGKPVGSVDAEGAPYKDCFGDLWLRGVKNYRNSTSTQAAGNTCTHSSKKPAQHCLR